MTRVARTAAITLVLGMLAFVVAGTFAAPMSTMEHEGMQGCMFMEVEALCAMSPLEHLALWQASFTTVAPQLTTASLILLILALALLGSFEFFIHTRPPPQFVFALAREREALPPPFLQELFSNGVLNSKRH